MLQAIAGRAVQIVSVGQGARHLHILDAALQLWEVFQEPLQHAILRAQKAAYYGGPKLDLLLESFRCIQNFKSTSNVLNMLNSTGGNTS